MGSNVMIKAADGGSFEAYLALPKGGKGPGLAVLPEMYNVNTTIRKVADAYAEQGFVALAPDCFWRIKPQTYLEYTDENRAIAKDYYYVRLDRDKATEDVGACLNYLRQHPQGNGKAAAVGFCMGGELCLLAGCRLPVDGLAIYYGTEMQRHYDEASKLAAPTIFNFAGADRFVSMDVVNTMKQKTAGKKHVEIYVYDGAGHAFASPRASNPDFNAAATKLASDRTMAFFKPLFR